MIAEGISKILVCNQVVGPVKVAELARIAGVAEVIVLVESAVNADRAGRRRSPMPAARSASSSSSTSACTGPACGASTRARARPARRGRRRPAPARRARLRGPLHARAGPRPAGAESARRRTVELIELADDLDRAGLSTEIVAAGGLGTWDITGANPRITEIHAGSYVFMDAFHRRLVPGFEPRSLGPRRRSPPATATSRSSTAAGSRSVSTGPCPSCSATRGLDPLRPRRVLPARGAHDPRARGRNRTSMSAIRSGSCPDTPPPP